MITADRMGHQVSTTSILTQPKIKITSGQRALERFDELNSYIDIDERISGYTELLQSKECCNFLTNNTQADIHWNLADDLLTLVDQQFDALSPSLTSRPLSVLDLLKSAHSHFQFALNNYIDPKNKGACEERLLEVSQKKDHLILTTAQEVIKSKELKIVSGIRLYKKKLEIPALISPEMLLKIQQLPQLGMSTEFELESILSVQPTFRTFIRLKNK